MLLRGGRVEAERARGRARGRAAACVPASAPAPSGRAREPAARGRAKRARVAREHLDEGEPVVGEPHRLRALEVRVAGQHRVDVLAGAREQHAAAARASPRCAARGGVAQVEREVGRDLVVAAAAGVQAPGGRRRSARAAAPRRSCGCPRARGRAGSSRPRSRAAIASRPGAIAARVVGGEQARGCRACGRGRARAAMS